MGTAAAAAAGRGGLVNNNFCSRFFYFFFFLPLDVDVGRIGDDFVRRKDLACYINDSPASMLEWWGPVLVSLR